MLLLQINRQFVKEINFEPRICAQNLFCFMLQF